MFRCMLALLLSTGTAFGQSLGSDGPINTNIGTRTTDTFGAQRSEFTWELKGEQIGSSEVVKELTSSGYDVGSDAEWLSKADNFTLYSKPFAPGEVIYLVVPNTKNIEPVTFAPTRLQFSLTNPDQVFGAGFSSDDIAERIIDGMKKSINSICQIGAQPQSITGRASAVGIVEIEATWLGDDICNAVQ